MRIALYQPDIPQNAGTILRMAACLAIEVDIILPAGFDLSDRALRRAGLDYLPYVTMRRHESFESFDRWRIAAGHRLVLATTKASVVYTDFLFDTRDILMLGRESAGVPNAVAERADARVIIPIKPGLRSLNVAVAAAMIVGEAQRQITAQRGSH